MTKFTSIAIAMALTLASAQAFAPTAQSQGAQSTKTTITTTAMAAEPSDSEGAVDRRMFGRAVFSTSAAVLTSALLSGQEEAQALPPTGRPKKALGDNRVFFKGRVTLREQDIPPALQAAKERALIVTARPKNVANVPPEVIRAGRGQIPAVFTAIIPKPSTFPVKFQLTSNDITPEGDFGLDGSPYWWADEPEWELSARVDTDGVLRTASPEDLVGRTITSQIGEDKAEQDVCVEVQERGFFGSRFQRREKA